MSAFGVEDFSPQGKNGLKLAVSPLLGRAPGGVAFDQVQLTFGRIAGLAIGQFAGQGHAFESAFPENGVFGGAGG